MVLYSKYAKLLIQRHFIEQYKRGSVQSDSYKKIKKRIEPSTYEYFENGTIKSLSMERYRMAMVQFFNI